MTVAELPERWRVEAEGLRRRGLDTAARQAESYADDLEACLREQEGRTVSLTEAATLSGYSADHLGDLVRQGVIPNAGRKQAPRIRMADLPRRPGCGTPTPA